MTEARPGAGSRPGSLLTRGVVAAERGRVAEGLALLQEYCAARPDDPEGYAQLARWLSLVHRPAGATVAAERALALRPQDARTLDTLGVVFSREGQHGRAVECFAAAVAADPARADFRFNLASSQKFLGRFDEAAQAYEACIALEPGHVRAHHGLAQLRTQSEASNHVARLAAVLASTQLDARAGLTLRHALAKELEDLGRHDEAFAHLADGKRRMRESCGYTFDQDAAMFDALRTAFPDRESVRAVAGASAARPIFVTGLPRTGTTLVDRILSSHSQVVSVGESQQFAAVLKRASGVRSPRAFDPPTIARLPSIDFGAAGRAYVEAVTPASGHPRFVDKTPLNVLCLGPIARALPGAVLVVVRRHPLDSIVANYRQLFGTGAASYHYSLDLDDLARYYIEFDRLVAHWRTVLPGRVHEVRYEELVARQHETTAALLEACGLAFEDACLSFERNPAPTATASAVQVRQPLHGSYVGRWRAHEARLVKVIALLREAGIEVAAGDPNAGSTRQAC